MNRLTPKRRYYTNTKNFVISVYEAWLEDGYINMNPDYQRPLVWNTENKRMFVENLINDFPVGAIAMAKIDDGSRYEIEIVDGKQRLNAIFSFMKDEFSIAGNDDSMLYYSDFTPAEKRRFRNLGLPAIMMEESTREDRLEYFYKTNFFGVPQSEEHRQHVIALLQDEQLKNN